MLITGSKEQVQNFLKRDLHEFYVYLLYQPDKTPFYVGKGCGDRVFQHEYEANHSQFCNPYKINTIKKIKNNGGEIIYGIDSVFMEEKLALNRERELIQEIGRPPLTNLTDGGEGFKNLDPRSWEKHMNTLYGDVGDDPRSTLNRIFQEFTAVKSVPIKPLKGFRAVHLMPHPKPRDYSPRMAAALFMGAVFNGVLIEEGAVIPRIVTIKDIDGIIENGVGRDILVAGWAEIIPNEDPKLEQFKLTKSGVTVLRRYLNELPKDVLNKYM